MKYIQYTVQVAGEDWFGFLKDWKYKHSYRDKSDADWMANYYRLVKNRVARVVMVETTIPE